MLFAKITRCEQARCLHVSWYMLSHLHNILADFKRSVMRYTGDSSNIAPQLTVSSTVRARTPGTSRFSLAGTMPRLDARPMVGRMPTHAQSLAGPRTESPVSVPMPTCAPDWLPSLKSAAHGVANTASNEADLPTRPKEAATAAAEPPLEPAVVRSAPSRNAAFHWWLEHTAGNPTCGCDM